MAADVGFIPPAQFVIGPCRGQLDRAVGVDQAAMRRPVGQGEVFHRPERMDAPQRVGGHVAGSQQVGFAAVFGHISQSPQSHPQSKVRVVPQSLKCP